MTHPARLGPGVCLTAALLGSAVLLATAAPSAYGATPVGRTVWKHYRVMSPATGKRERFWIGCPTNLEPGHLVPVIYFLPGLLDNENRWKDALDPHLGQHSVIAVCPSVGGSTWFLNSPRQPWMRWGDFLTGELRNFVEVEYPGCRAKGGRGIVGISAGANAALYHAFTSDLYGAVGVMSGALALPSYAGTAGLDYWIGPRSPATQALYVERSALWLADTRPTPFPFDLWLDVGDSDGARPMMDALKKTLDSRGLPYDWNVGHGGHHWGYWKTRVPDLLAWFGAAFARNGREKRFSAETEVSPTTLEMLGPPPIALSDTTLQRLHAPWPEDETGRTVSVTGLPEGGAPLSRADAATSSATVTAGLADVVRYEPLAQIYRLEATVATPARGAGTISLSARLLNGRMMGILYLASQLPVPGGEPNRRARVRARLAIEFKDPDPLRGGILLALQPFDSSGCPLGDPFIAQGRPGTVGLEYWMVAAQGRLQMIFSLSGDGDLPLAAIAATRLQAEP